MSRGSLSWPEDLRLDPQNLCKKAGFRDMCLSPQRDKQIPELVGWPAQANLWVSGLVRYTFSKKHKRWRGPRRDTGHPSLPFHLQTNVLTPTLTNIWNTQAYRTHTKHHTHTQEVILVCCWLFYSFGYLHFGGTATQFPNKSHRGLLLLINKCPALAWLISS